MSIHAAAIEILMARVYFQQLHLDADADLAADGLSRLDAALGCWG